MIKRFVITVMLLTCSSLSHPSAAPEEFSIVAERVTHDLTKTLENQLNENLGTGHLPVYVSFIPVSRDQLIPALLEGRRDGSGSQRLV